MREPWEAGHDVNDIVRFLRQHNAAKSPVDRVSFWSGSLQHERLYWAVLKYLDRVDPKAADAADQGRE